MQSSMGSAERLDRVGRDLLGAMKQVIASIPDAPRRPQNFAREVGVNKDVASRLFAAMRSKDVLAAMHRMPGSAALRQVLGVAGAKGASEDLVQGAHTALSAYDAFVRDHFEDRAGLDAFIGASLPHARRKLEAAAKQSIFRGAAVLKGVISEAMLSTFITFPSAKDGGQLCDLAVVNGFIGIRRVRPGAPIQFSHVSHTSDYDKPAAADLGEPFGSHVLGGFCSPPSPALTVEREEKTVTYALQDTGVGPRSAVDMFTADHFPSNYSRGRTAAAPGSRWFYAQPEYPTKVMVIDLFVRRDLWPDASPRLWIYDTDRRGVASVNDRSRDRDRLETAENIEPLGTGTARARSEDIPRYDELLNFMFGRLGQQADEFRCYRCRIAYPVPSWQITMEFSPPAES